MDLVQHPFMVDFMVHCVDGCSRGYWHDLRGVKPSDVRCTHCGSDKVAIWHNRQCIYAHSGKVTQPMGDTPFGTIVRGPSPKGDQKDD